MKALLVKLKELLRSQPALVIGAGTVAIFFGTGNRLVENISHPLLLAAVFAWLFVAILCSAIWVVRHADCLAVRFGEPYGTLILTFSAITIEVTMISVAVLHGANNPVFGRDVIFAIIMLALNGLVGACLLMGGLRHREQRYNLQGVNSYLNVIMTLAVLGLVLPNFTTSTSGPTLSSGQGIFLAVTSVLLYGVFLLIQTMRHSRYFMESEDVVMAVTKSTHHKQLKVRSTSYHSAMLFVYLLTVVLLSEKFAIPLDNSMEKLAMPHAFGGTIVAALVLAPEGIGAIEAALRNQLQRSVNIILGSTLATIGLTIPAVLTISVITSRSIVLGVQGGNLLLLLLTLAVSVVTFSSGKTNILQGCIHLLLCVVYGLLMFAP
jgi:Ca2+:H+ antiporter